MQVRLTEREHQAFEKHAEMQGLPLSSWVRMMLLRAVGIIAK